VSENREITGFLEVIYEKNKNSGAAVYRESVKESEFLYKRLFETTSLEC
jgi:hypothetical protein